MKTRLALGALTAVLLTACGGDATPTPPPQASAAAPSTSVSTGASQGGGGAVIVTQPPASLHLDPYYMKYLDASGIPVVGNIWVSDTAMFAMKRIVDVMVQKDPWTRSQLALHLKRVLIIPRADGMTSLPEYRTLDITNPLPNGETWNQRAQGLGWTAAIPYASCSEANLLHSGAPQDRYGAESICIHEFAHAVWDAGVVYRDSAAQGRLNAAFNAAKAGYMHNSTTYAAVNVSEYWAEGVQAWFNAAACQVANTLTCTNLALYQTDPALWNEIGHWFPAPAEVSPAIYVHL